MRGEAGSVLRVLAVDPVTNGFGFAVLEGPEGLVDWGVAHVPGEGRSEAMQRLRALLTRYRPRCLVIEDPERPGSRRRGRGRRFLESVPTMARERKVRVCKLTRKAIKRFFAEGGGISKHEVAVRIAERFPELAPRLPRRRKPWMSEDERMSIFTSVAMALTFYEQALRRDSKRNTQDEPPADPGDH